MHVELDLHYLYLGIKIKTTYITHVRGRTAGESIHFELVVSFHCTGGCSIITDRTLSVPMDTPARRAAHNAPGPPVVYRIYGVGEGNGWLLL